jgi:hypothetical protein
MGVRRSLHFMPPDVCDYVPSVPMFSMPIGTQSASRRPRWLAAHGKTLHRVPLPRIRHGTSLRGRRRGVKIPMGTLVSMKAVYRPEPA